MHVSSGIRSSFRAPPTLSRRAALAAGGGALVSVAQLALGVSACSEANTGGKRVELVTTVDADTLSFVNAYDLKVELELALLSIGPLRYVEGAPVALREPARRRARWIEALSSVRTAHAHPGHYEEGQTLGEMLRPTTVDLAAGPTDLGSSPGVSGVARSALFCFQSPPAGELAASLGDDVVLIEGTATSLASGDSLRFRARASVEQVLDAEGQPFVAGCELDDGNIQENGSVRLLVFPSVWLDQTDFSELSTNDDEPIELDPATTPHKAFVRGLKKAAAYGFTYEAGSSSRS